jgi:hypothetical protein
MRKLFVLVVLIGLLLSVLPATATPTVDLVSLAQYFPATTPIFGVIRTDAGYIETLDGLLARIASAVPMGVPGRLSTMLDMAAQQIDPEGDFQSVFRSWLGDSAAFGLISLEGQGNGNPPFVIAIEVTNRAEAESFTDAFLRETNADFSVTTEDAFTIYEVENENVAVAVTDNVLFLTETVDTLQMLNTREARLNTNSTFTDTLDRLPNGDYDMVLYLDSPSLTRMMVETNQLSTNDTEVGPVMEGFLNASAPQAVGISLVNGTNLIVDSAQLAGDTSGLEELGFVVPTSMTPVNLDFAAYVPADAPIVVLGTNLSETYNLMVENLRAASAMQVAAANQEATDFEEGLRFIEIGVRGLTGLDLQEDILGWMTGGYGLFFNVNPAALDDPESVMPMDFGLVFEATDPEAAQAVVDGIREAIMQAQPENVTLSQETVAGVDAAVIVAEPEDEPYPVEVLVGANDDVFVIGTRNAFTGVFEADGGLAADAAFNEAATYFLDGSAVAFYFSPQPLAGLAEVLAGSEDREMQQSGLFLNVLSSLLHSGSITGAFNEDGTRGRFVLSLAA